MTHSSKENRDVYYRKAKEDGYRARSAYKLLQIFQNFGILHPPATLEEARETLISCRCVCKNNSQDSKNLQNNKTPQNIKNYENSQNPTCRSPIRFRNIVDLCSAPGSWSQCLRNFVYDDFNIFLSESQKLFDQGLICSELFDYCKRLPVIVSIDLQEMAPIKGVKILKGDITDPAVLDQVKDIFISNVIEQQKRNVGDEGEIPTTSCNLADLITCDGAPDISGLHEADAYFQTSLIRSALKVCVSLLSSNGVFICKSFSKDASSPIFAGLSIFFSDVRICKPEASRSSSGECFIVGRGFRPVGGILDVILYGDLEEYELSNQVDGQSKLERA